jgi:coenzyme F420-0:L-glutamate ligase / coenzyme F420-1:gamma-L-glutamate ligase
VIASRSEAASRIELIALEGIPEVAPGDDLASLIAAACDAAGIGLTDADVLVVTQKVVSKAEGRLVELTGVEPSLMARDWAARWDKDPRQVELVLRESAAIVRMAPGGLIISRTGHGFVCANAGVDVSNVGGGEVATLLPEDPDASARRIRSRLGDLTGASPAVVISDSFGRPWRNGIVNVAVGAAGIEPLRDLRGTPDAAGREMHATIIAVADELASAADLAGGKVEQRPVVLVRNYAWRASDEGASALIMEPARDLFP